MNLASTQQLSIGQCVHLACLFEATAPKPGNVHRGADFEDLTYVDLLQSAAAIAPIMDHAPARSLGRTILDAISATRTVASTNTNLGIVLLLAPLAKAAEPRREAVRVVLEELTLQDARDVYAAIRLARPGGMGQVDQGDVQAEPSRGLVEAMRLAEDRDLVARQYARNFSEVFETALPVLVQGVAAGWTLGQTIVHTHLSLMAELPDSLIARKCGVAMAQESADRAADALLQGGPGEEPFQRAVAQIDFWLRADGHRRNPGATADVLAAALYAGLRAGSISPATPFYPAL